MIPQTKFPGRCLHDLRSRARMFALAFLMTRIGNLAIAGPSLDDLIPMDLGAPSVPGQMSVTNGTATVAAAGGGIGARSDDGFFAAVALTNDFDWRVCVSRLDTVHLWSRAGIMVREGTNSNGRMVGVFATPSSVGSHAQWRNNVGAVATSTGFFPANFPFSWLRLRRETNVFRAFAGYDGVHWTPLGSVELGLEGETTVGLAVSSRDSQRATTAVFRDFSEVTPDLALDRLDIDREPLGPVNRRTPWVISEIHYNPGRGIQSQEFVELHNTSPFTEDLTGHSLNGEVLYEFPAGTVVPGGGYVVVAADPDLLRNSVGSAKVLGPLVGRLSNEDGTIRLINELGGVLIEAAYDSEDAGLLGADGFGHSLVLARASFGAANPRAWSISRIKGGSPGASDAIEPLPESGLRLNELMGSRTGNPGFVEIFNAGGSRVSLGGLRLRTPDSDRIQVLPGPNDLDPGRFFVVSATNIGFELGVHGQRIVLESADGTRILDAVEFPASADGHSTIRFPDGAETMYAASSVTPGGANPRPEFPVVFSEIHFHPRLDSRAETFLEIFNRSGRSQDLGRWRLHGGVRFDFAPGTMLEAGRALVIAADKAQFLRSNPTLDSRSVVGDFDGSLSRRGEGLILSKPVRFTSSGSVLDYETVTRATYTDASRHSRWADGGGSSLELIHPDADSNLTTNWKDSDESSESKWVTVESEARLEFGQGNADNLHILLMGEGECLVDNVEVLDSGGTNLVTNPTFEAGQAGWVFQGNHIRSSIDPNAGENGSGALHIRASGNGDTGANKIRTRLRRQPRLDSPVTLRARVRWLAGWPEILLRMKGNGTEAFGSMPMTPSSGSPGVVALSTSIPPAIHAVRHFPVLPQPGETVRITARLDAPGGIAEAWVRHRLDPQTETQRAALRDDGLEGDVVPGDGVYSARIQGPAAAGIVAFVIEARSGGAAGADAIFPPGGASRECLVRFGDATPAGAFGSYRMWITATNSRAWSQRPNLSNEPADLTFVYGDWRVVYNAGGRFAGSPYHQQFSGPTSEAHYVIAFPGDDRVMDATSFNKVHAPGNGPFDDNTIQREQATYWMARKLGVPTFHRRYIHMFVNGSRRRTLMEDTQVGGDDFAAEYWPDDADGHMFKLQPWFEFDDSNSTSIPFNNNSWCFLQDYFDPGGQRRIHRYRWNWLMRGVDGTANNFQPVFQLISTASSQFRDTAALESEMDVDNWLKCFAVNHAVGNWDSVGYFNAQNTYAYKPRNGRWRLILWDANIVMGNSGSHGPTGLPLTGTSDQTIAQWFVDGSLRRRYFAELDILANQFMRADAVGAWMDARHAVLADHGISAVSPNGVKSWLQTARQDILSQIGGESAPFRVAAADGIDFEHSPDVVTIRGDAPFRVVEFLVNDRRIKPVWEGASSWRMDLPQSELNSLRVQGVDASGNVVPGATTNVTVRWMAASDTLAFTEIMHRPAVPGADFVELINRASLPMDIGGWTIEGLDFVFPPNFVVQPGAPIVLIRDYAAFQNAYGARTPVAGLYTRPLSPDGQTLRLVRSGPVREIVSAVKFGGDSPWPGAVPNGVSLQFDTTAGTHPGQPGNWRAILPEVADTNIWKSASVTGVASGNRILLHLSSNPPFLATNNPSGVFRATVQGFRYHIRVEAVGEGFKGELFFGDEESPAGVTSTRFDGSLLRLEVANNNFWWEGRLTSGGNVLSGAFVFEGGRSPVTFRRQNPGGQVYIDDLSLVEGGKPGVGINLIRNPDFSGSLDGTWNRSGTHEASEIVPGLGTDGGPVLRLGATAGGEGSTNNAFWQDVPELVPGRTYTLGFRYRVADATSESVVLRWEAGPYVRGNLKPTEQNHPEYSIGSPSPGSGAGVNAPRLWISEIQPGDPGRLEFYNSGVLPLVWTNLAVRLPDGSKVDLPDGVHLGAGEFFTVRISREAAGGDTLRGELPLTGGTVTLTWMTGGELFALDSGVYPQSVSGKSFGRTPENVPTEFLELESPSPGRPNSPASRFGSVSFEKAFGFPWLRWAVYPGRSYRLESTLSLSPPDWKTVETRRVFSPDGNWLLPLGEASQQFYRLVETP